MPTEKMIKPIIEQPSKLLAIATRESKRSNMKLLQNAHISFEFGVEKDFRGKSGKRQVTILSHQAWLQACKDLDCDLDWLTRRANLLVNNIDLIQSTGKIIRIGNVKLLITGETDPCSRMEEAKTGLFDALVTDERGGVCCQVISEGAIAVNDEVIIYE